jgi:mono/diheme cytochrome c family protein
MREGVARDGSHLFAAFPHNVYTGLWDESVKALYAYLMIRPPVSDTVPPNTVPFPLNIRSLEEGWKILFFRSERYRTDPAESEEWNRGAYLAQALSDCEGCHTPRNALGALKTRDLYAGATIDGWVAPALTKANPGSSRQQDLALRSRIRRWQPQLRTLFVIRIALLKYVLQLRGFELPEAVRLAQQQFDNESAKILEGMANRLDGKPSRGDDGFEASFEQLQQIVRSCCSEGPQESLTPNVQTILALSRNTASLTMSLRASFDRRVLVAQ